MKSPGPFQKHFKVGKCDVYKKANLKKLTAWDGQGLEAYHNFFGAITLWQLTRSMAVIKSALQHNPDGSLTEAAEDFLQRILLLSHCMTFAQGGKIYLRNKMHPPGEYLNDLPDTLNALRLEFNRHGGYFQWLRNGGLNSPFPHNIYNRISWERKRSDDGSVTASTAL